MKFEDGVTTFVEHFLERETPPSVLFGFWDEVQGALTSTRPAFRLRTRTR